MAWKGVLIGCGYISGRHLWAWQRISNAEIVAVCDRDGDKARQKAVEFGLGSFFTDPERMFDETSPDFVDVATGPESHLELAVRAAARGLHVLCQKPLAPSMADAARIVSACREAGVTLMVNENGRHQAWYRRMKSLLSEGRVGPPHYARFEMRRRWSLPEPNFGGQPYFQKMPRLVVYEMGIHFLDTARYLFGEADSVYAQVRRVSPHIAGEDLAVLMVNFGDLICLIDINWGNESRSGPDLTWGPAVIEGREGTVVLGPDGVLSLHTDHSRQAWSFPEDTYLCSFAAAQGHFIECLETGRAPETSGEDNLKSTALVFASYRSAEEGRAVAPEEVMRA